MTERSLKIPSKFLNLNFKITNIFNDQFIRFFVSVKLKILFVGLIIFSSQFGHAQVFSIDSLERKFDQLEHFFFFRYHDTTYIKSYFDQFALKIVANKKFNYFNIRDKNNETALRYRPENGINLGFGISYKWFALDITFNIGIHEDENFTQKEAFDFQGRIFSSRQFMEGSLQYYYGYKLGKITGINDVLTDMQKIRNDIRTISFGLQYLYAFNYTRFSLKAPFILNEIQKKSAGSMIFGASFAFFTMDADSSIVPVEYTDFFDPALQITDLSVISLAVNFGYMYTFVYKEHFFLTLGIIPGLSFNMGDYNTDSRDLFKWNVSYKIKTMNAIGYNSEKYFAGMQLVGDWNNVMLQKKLHSLFNQGSLKLFVGYRFGKRKNKSSEEMDL